MISKRLALKLPSAQNNLTILLAVVRETAAAFPIAVTLASTRVSIFGSLFPSAYHSS